MALSENQRKLIDKKVKYIPCPLCGGKMMFYVDPYQLVCIPYSETNDSDSTIKIEHVPVMNYLASECQECGYVILRRLDILLGKKVAERIEET